MDLNLRNKVVLITGGSRGIGLATSIAFAKEGANVVINYREKDGKAFEALNKVLEYSSKSILYKSDISNENQVIKMVNDIQKRFGQIDVLINNASIVKDSSLLEKNTSDWEKTLKTNLLGTFLCSREVSKHMIKRKTGKIINISSTSALYAFEPEIVDYDVSKAGVIVLTKNFAKALAPHINVNCIAPGWVNTDINKDLSEDYLKEEIKVIYKQRIAKPIEIANVCLFLSSEKSSYINGAVITVDGGHD